MCVIKYPAKMSKLSLNLNRKIQKGERGNNLERGERRGRKSFENGSFNKEGKGRRKERTRDSLRIFLANNFVRLKLQFPFLAADSYSVSSKAQLTFHLPEINSFHQMTMDTDDPKGQLSLTAQADDYLRLVYSVITNQSAIPDRLLDLLKDNSDLRRKWISNRDELSQCRSKIVQLERELEKKDKMNKNLLHRIDTEAKTNEKLRNEKKSLKQKLDVIRQCLTDDSNEKNPNHDRIMSVLNIPQLDTLHEDSEEEHSLSDLDYDKTGDDLEVSRRISNGKRKSSNGIRRRSDRRASKEINKRPKSSDEEDLDIDMDIDLNEPDVAVEAIEVNGFQGRQPIQRTLFKSQTNVVNPVPRITTISTPALARSPFSAKPKSSDSMGPRLENKCHQWQHKNSVRSLKCGPCGSQIKWFSPYIACAQCMMHCHAECKNKVPNPCIPFIPRSRGAGENGKKWPLTDFVSKDKPMIPALIYYCCNEIEKRGLSEVGLYRVSGSDKEIKQLKDHILNSKSGMPSLASYEIPVICGVLKEFLKCLDEPLITNILRNDFMRAAEATSSEEKTELLYKAVSELPPANRDTLAFLMAHLQKISRSTDCKMPIDNIAKVLAPTIVGEDCEVVNNQFPVPKMLKLIRQQFQLMKILLETPTEYWNECINRESSADQNDRRASFERRAFGGTVQTNGCLTPAHPPTSAASSSRSAYGFLSSARKPGNTIKKLF